MSHKNSTAKELAYYPKARQAGTCKTCETTIPRGEPAWWSARAGWRCTDCGGRIGLGTRYAITPVYRCKLVKEGSVNSEDRIASSEAAGRVAGKLLCDSPNERLLAILLNTKNVVIGVSEISSGTLNASLVHPREVFRPAILANAAAVIIAHNHPSGELTPSREDWEVYRRLEVAGENIGIRVLDSIIVNDAHQYLSMQETRV
jgi:DNA repair protein RadC